MLLVVFEIFCGIVVMFEDIVVVCGVLLLLVVKVMVDVVVIIVCVCVCEEGNMFKRLIFIVECCIFILMLIE